MQDGVVVGNGYIEGKLKYLSSGSLVTTYGAGYFMALTLADNDFTGFDSVKVGLRPSVSTGLVEILTDPDKNGGFKVTDPFTQVFVVQKTKGTQVEEQVYSLARMQMIPAAEG